MHLHFQNTSFFFAIPLGKGNQQPMKNRIIPYNPRLKELARNLRKQGILSEVLLWKHIQKKSLGVEFHRQVPLDEYIVDFYCHELMLAIEIDGNSHLFDNIAVNDVKRQVNWKSWM